MSWHYLPVYKIHKSEVLGKLETSRSYGLVEVYLNDHRQLEAWTAWENPEKAAAPYGANIKELRSDLSHMLNDLNRWEPVNYDELKPGMRFIRRKSNYRQRRAERTKTAAVIPR